MTVKIPVLFLLCLFVLAPLPAQVPPDLPELLRPALAGAPEPVSRAVVLMDAASGTVLYAKNPGEVIPPASLTKLMTMHIVLEEAAAAGLSLDDPFSPPRESWAVNQPPRSSLMFLAAGQRLSLRELLLGLAVPSGNDAAVAAALRFFPTVEDFTARMNAEARRMGLANTRFVEPSGISEHNRTTAGDFARFCREYLRLHPENLKNFHSVQEFAYPKAENVREAFRDNPQTINQANRNGLLKTFPGVDGLKTGYIDEAGYNIALTAGREETRFILVILGAPARPNGDRIRDADGERLLAWAFDSFRTIRPAVGDPEPARLWKGKTNRIHLVPAGTAAFTAPLGRGHSLWLSTELQDPIVAPVPAGRVLGSLIISDEQGELHRIPLASAEAGERGGFFRRLWDSIRLFFRRIGTG
ncbi:MAG: D-alanyl-D-alanine carboxypeptidase [Treponema sp.]|jgi:D-alanyl-D-alanine carboxypeptidase (penicillin-binding protein 5/6)|nr:D-alanyl-D-alanine carboxypeptidase [Treponema sp.]